jgi:hypothetical protein
VLIVLAVFARAAGFFFFVVLRWVHAKFVYSVDRENNKLAIALHDEVAKRIGDRLGATFGGKILIGELLE